MNHIPRISALLIRLSLGWLFLFSGISKINNPNWTAANYIKSAKTFPGLYEWFASPENIGWVNLLNEWGMALIGAALILGIAVRPASLAGFMLMLLYYFPILDFPKAGEAYIVDQHIIYAFCLLFIATVRAGQFLGIDGLIVNTSSSQGKLTRWIFG